MVVQSEPQLAVEPSQYSFFRDLVGLLECPETNLPVDVRGEEFVVWATGRRYPVADGIPNLFVPNAGAAKGIDVTELVKQFYEETPFPNYDDVDSRDSLAAKARRSVFPAALDEQIPENAIVLEAGCGTGQLTNFLGSSWKRRVIGGDICLNSLRLAKEFRDRNLIHNAGFLQMNLFHPPFRDESFDLIISNGVLHHTGDPEAGMAALIKKLKPGGIISIGLYNSYARLPTLWRRWLFERFGKSFHVLDPRLRRPHHNASRVEAWYADQYTHPHESKHSMDEVLTWFARHDIDFLGGIPHPDGSQSAGDERLFEIHSKGSRLTRVATQLSMLLSGGADGGLFIMIGRKVR
jgi:SAM-dependent methyltransferase